MANDTNSIVLSGNLTRDPEMKYTGEGLAVCSFTVANNRGFGDRQRTGFYLVEAWRKTAEICERYLKKGSGVTITGELSQDQWDDRATGQKKSRTKIVAREVKFDRAERQAHNGGNMAHNCANNPPPFEPKPDTMDDIPF